MKRVFVTLLLLVPALTVRAGDQNLLIYLEERSTAFPNGVSASGAVVVGGLGSGGGFYWMPTTGVVFIGGVGATKVSLDGRTIVGQVLDARLLQAGIWVRGAEWKPLGSFTPTAAPCDAFLSLATDTSADGRVVVGYARDGCSVSHAFKWEESTGMVDLGSSVAGQGSLATAISPDGKVVVGYQEAENGFLHGAQWRDGRQERFIGPHFFVGAANATNHDGSLVVGRVCSAVDESLQNPNPYGQSAWIWTPRDGLTCLPAPRRVPSPGPVIIVEANATSDDGRVIGGTQGIGDDANAILWIDRAPVYLKDYLQANGVPDAFKDWVNTGSITDVSPDGRVLVGKGAAPAGFRGYIVILGEKP